MLKTVLTYGTAAGLIAGGACFATTTLIPGHLPNMWGMALSLLPVLSSTSAPPVGLGEPLLEVTARTVPIGSTRMAPSAPLVAL